MMAYKYLTIFLLSSISTYLLVPNIIKIGRRYNYVDPPGKGKHKKT